MLNHLKEGETLIIVQTNLVSQWLQFIIGVFRFSTQDSAIILLFIDNW